MKLAGKGLPEGFFRAVIIEDKNVRNCAYLYFPETYTLVI